MKSNDSANSVPASTQLNGTTDEPVKQQQSPKKKKSAKSVASVDAAQSIFNESTPCGNLADAFATLQEIIEALDTVGNVKDAKLTVTLR